MSVISRADAYMLVAADALRRARSEINKSSIPGAGKTARIKEIEKTQRQLSKCRATNDQGPVR